MINFPNYQGPRDASFNFSELNLEMTLLSLQERFSSPIPVSQEEIEEMYKTLFLGTFTDKIKSYLDDEQHIASVVFSLHSIIQHWKENASSAVVSTKDSMNNGANGSYFLKDASGNINWVFKPVSEEAQLGIDIPRGGGVIREHLASLVNFDKIYPIPFTTLVTLFGLTGSVQRFVPGKSLRLLQEESQGFISENVREEIQAQAKQTLQNLPPREFQAKLIFDIIFGNGDAHEGNLLCALKPTVCFHSIDHGNICSNSAEAPLYVPYLRMMPRNELNEELKQYCRTLPTERFSHLMKEHGFTVEAISFMQARGNWLSSGIAQGLNLIEIALPLILNPTLIHSVNTDLSKLSKDIRNCRERLEDACAQTKWNEVKQLLEDLKRGKIIPDLIHGEDEFSRLWHNYLKPILLCYPESKSIREEIGSMI